MAIRPRIGGAASPNYGRRYWSASLSGWIYVADDDSEFVWEEDQLAGR